MSKIEKVCATCKHYQSDEHCVGCTFDWKNTDGNTHWEPQEPFINKPCVSEGVCREDKIKVLEKIRAEIALYKDDKIIHAERNEMIDIVLEIIEKYKAESEDKE